MQDHATLGFIMATGRDSEITGVFMRAPRNTTSGRSLFNAILGPGSAGSESVAMRQTSLGLAWAQRF